MKLSTGDSVLIISGKDKGKKGSVLRVLKDQGRVIVSGVNIRTKHVKKSVETAGKIVKYEASLSASNVMLLDPKSGKPTRLGYKTGTDGKKVRIAKVSGATVGRTKLSEKKEEKAASVPGVTVTEAPKKTSWFGSKSSGPGQKVEAGPAQSNVPLSRSAGRGS